MVTTATQSTAKRNLLIGFLIGMALLATIGAVILMVIIRTNWPYGWSQEVTATIVGARLAEG